MYADFRSGHQAKAAPFFIEKIEERNFFVCAKVA
jgi:hypothetical protein